METGFYKNLTASGLVHTGAAQFRKLVVNKPIASGVITIYDGVDTNGTKIGTITYPATLLNDAPVSLDYFANCNAGIYIAITGSVDVTVVYR